MKIKVSDYQCAAIICQQECKFQKSCANHESAGDYRSEGGFSPQLTKTGDEVFCHTCHEEAAEDIGFDILPKNHHELLSGSVLWKDISMPSDEMILGKSYRLTLCANGKEFMGMSVSGHEPKQSGDILPVLKEIVRMLEAPDMPDEEVLGKYSPVVSTTSGVGKAAEEFLKVNPDFWPELGTIPNDGAVVDNDVPIEVLCKAVESVGEEQTRRMEGLV